MGEYMNNNYPENFNDWIRSWVNFSIYQKGTVRQNELETGRVVS